MSSKKILIVDDEKDILKILETKLSKQGYWVMVAETGAEAISKVKEAAPDLILMDVLGCFQIKMGQK